MVRSPRPRTRPRSARHSRIRTSPPISPKRSWSSSPACTRARRPASTSSSRSTRSSTATSATSCSGARACRATCPTEPGIPIAQFGRSNVGRAKTVYRTGLSYRYGRRMQTISGIHYNFSLPESAWPLPGLADANAAYFALIRNFRRHGWMLLYLFGASPRRVRKLRPGPLPRPGRARARNPLSARCHLASHGAPGLPERSAGFALRELQRSRELRRLAARRSDAALSALRGDRHPRRRHLPPACREPAPDRERVLQHDPAEARDPARANGRCTRCASGGSSTWKCVRWTSTLSRPIGITADTIRFLDVFLLHCLLTESPPDTPAGDRGERTEQAAGGSARTGTRAAPGAKW